MHFIELGIIRYTVLREKHKGSRHFTIMRSHDNMEGRLLLDNRTLAFKARPLFTEATLENGVHGEDNVVFLQFFGVGDEVSISLHNCNRGTTKQVETESK
jgi:hypothetical protein